MTVLLVALVGVLIGWGLNWLSNVLPQASGVPVPRTSQSASSRLPALWEALSALRTPQNPRRWSALHLGTELLSIAAFLAIWARLGFSGQAFALAGIFTYFLLVALVDIKHRLVLNLLMYPAIFGLLALYVLVLHRNILYVLLGGMFAFTIFGLTAWLQPGKLGGGDVKLATLIGVAFGFPQVMYTLLVGGGLGGIVSIVLLLSRRASRSDTLPYAPFLCFGAVVIMLLNVWQT